MSRAAAPARGAIGGGVLVFLGELLALPAAVVLVIFLSRTLGPAGYGVFALAGVTVLWLKHASLALLSKATMAAVASEPDPRPVVATALRVELAFDVAAVAAVWALAGPLARLLHEPELAWVLRVLAFEVPLAGIARVHCDTLMGLGRFRRSAAVAAALSAARVALVVLLVGGGLGMLGAAAGCVLAAGIAAVVSRPGLGGRVLRGRGWPVRRLARTGVPLFLMAVAMLVVARVDLFAIKLAGASSAVAGRYAAAQSIAYTLGLVTVAMGPVLLSTLVRLRSAGETAAARETVHAALRILVLLTPLVALGSAAAPGLVALVLGDAFAGAAAYLSVLLFAAQALLVQTACVAILTAAGRPGLALRLSWPAPLAAVLGHALLTARHGPVAAAGVTIGVMLLVAAAHVVAVRRVWAAPLPLAPGLRAGAIALLVAALARLAPAATAAWLVLELAALGAGVVLLYLATGEVGRRELELVRAMLPRPRAAGEAAAAVEP